MVNLAKLDQICWAKIVPFLSHQQVIRLTLSCRYTFSSVRDLYRRVPDHFFLGKVLPFLDPKERGHLLFTQKKYYRYWNPTTAHVMNTWTLRPGICYYPKSVWLSDPCHTTSLAHMCRLTPCRHCGNHEPFNAYLSYQEYLCRFHIPGTTAYRSTVCLGWF